MPVQKNHRDQGGHGHAGSGMDASGAGWGEVRPELWTKVSRADTSALFLDKRFKILLEASGSLKGVLDNTWNVGNIGFPERSPQP